MYVNRAVELTSDIEHRFQNFIVFEPASIRVNPSDILYMGEEVKEVFDTIYESIDDSSLKSQILINHLSKIKQMLDLITNFDNIIMTKFFDRIWRRYSYVSNIGETFVDIRTYLNALEKPEIDKNDLLAQRIDEEDEESPESLSDDDDDDDNDTTAKLKDIEPVEVSKKKSSETIA